MVPFKFDAYPREQSLKPSRAPGTVHEAPSLSHSKNHARAKLGGWKQQLRGGKPGNVLFSGIRRNFPKAEINLPVVFTFGALLRRTRCINRHVSLFPQVEIDLPVGPTCRFWRFQKGKWRTRCIKKLLTFLGWLLVGSLNSHNSGRVSSPTWPLSHELGPSPNRVTPGSRRASQAEIPQASAPEW